MTELCNLVAEIYVILMEASSGIPSGHYNCTSTLNLMKKVSICCAVVGGSIQVGLQVPEVPDT